MQQLNLYEVKTHLSKLVDLANHGETIIIAKSGKPWAKIIPFEAPSKKIKFGTLKGQIKIADDFDATLPQDLLASFETDGESSR